MSDSDDSSVYSFTDMDRLQKESAGAVRDSKVLTLAVSSVKDELESLKSKLDDLSQIVGNTQSNMISTPYHTNRPPSPFDPFNVRHLTNVTHTPSRTSAPTLPSNPPVIPSSVYFPSSVTNNPPSFGVPLNTQTSVSYPLSSTIPLSTIPLYTQAARNNPFSGFSGMNNTNPFQVAQSNSQAQGLFRPKDVSILKLSELQGVGSDIRLNTFFRQVESCSDSDNLRIEIALARSEPDIATFISAEVFSRSNGLPWDDLKQIMVGHFTTFSATLVQAWQEVTAMTYCSDEPPGLFLNRLRCKISALKLKYPESQIPVSDTFLKKKVFQGLTLDR